MGNGDDGNALLVELAEQLHNIFTGLAVQCAGRFVRQQKLRIAHNRAGNRCALALTAGHLIRVKLHAVTQSNFFQHLGRPCAALFFAHAAIQQRQRNVVQCCQFRQQIRVLKDKSQCFISDFRHAIFRQTGNFFSVQQKCTGGRNIQTADNIHQRGLSRTGRPHNRDVLALLHRKSHMLEHRNRQLSPRIIFENIAACNDLTHYDAPSSAGIAAEPISPDIRRRIL